MYLLVRAEYWAISSIQTRSHKRTLNGGQDNPMTNTAVSTIYLAMGAIRSHNPIPHVLRLDRFSEQKSIL